MAPAQRSGRIFFEEFRLKGLYLVDSETAQVNWITRFSEFESDQSEPQLTQLFHAAGNLVAGLQP
jgi:hypothetical protein